MRRVVKRPIGAHSASKKSLMRFRPTAVLKGQTQSPKLILLRVWAEQNNYSIEQCHRLIRDRYLLAAKFRNRWLVAPNPNCVDEEGNFLFD